MPEGGSGSDVFFLLRSINGRESSKDSQELSEILPVDTSEWWLAHWTKHVG